MTREHVRRVSAALLAAMAAVAPAAVGHGG
jgi:hypothetical protein